MRRNMGNLDRAIRAFVLAPVAIVIALALGVGTVGGVLLLVVAAIMVSTAAIGFCPLYAPFGIKTCRRQVTA